MLTTFYLWRNCDSEEDMSLSCLLRQSSALPFYHVNNINKYLKWIIEGPSVNGLDS